MTYFISDMTDQILDELASILIKVEKVKPKYIAQLSLSTDLRNCLKLGDHQLFIFKYHLKKTYNLPFDQINIDREQIKIKEIVTYLIIHSECKMIYKWAGLKKIA